MYSREGVTQGYPLAIIDCGIGILQLIKTPKRELPELTQTWYSENTRALVTFTIIKEFVLL